MLAPLGGRSSTPTPARPSADPAADVDPARNPGTPALGLGSHAAAHPELPQTVKLPSVRKGTPVHQVAPAPDASDPMVGRVIENRFRIMERLGIGGMGTVYRARHEHMNKTLAVKVLNPTLSADAVVRARFRREARAASLLESPHTVAVFDFGETADGLLFLAMEHLRGTTLAELLRTEKQLPPNRAFRIVGHVLKSLEEAHSHGVVHRDIKPENIFLLEGRDGDFAKVLDFGIAKGERIQEPNGPGMGPQTRADLVVGTPEYMAPEQARGQPVDGRADLWACGVVLYECLLGRLPFQGETPVDTLVALMERTLPTPPAGSLHPSAWRVVEKALQKKAAQRFESAAAMRSAMENALAEMTQTPLAAIMLTPAPLPRGALAPLIGEGPDAADGGDGLEDTLDREAWGAFEGSQRKRRWLAGVVVAGLVGVAGVGALRLVDRGAPGTQEQEPNDKAVAATPISPGVMSGVLAAPQDGRKDQDYFVMELPEGPQVLAASVVPSAPTNVSLGISAWVDNKLVFKGYGARVTHPRIQNLTVSGRMLYLMVREERVGTVDSHTPARDAVPYALTIQPLRAPTAGEEREPNDDPADAPTLHHGQTLSALCSPDDDEDTFRLGGTPEDEELEVELTPFRTLALDVAINGADGKRAARRQGKPGEKVVLKVQTRKCGGACTLVVSGASTGDGEPAYQLVFR